MVISFYPFYRQKSLLRRLSFYEIQLFVILTWPFFLFRCISMIRILNEITTPMRRLFVEVGALWHWVGGWDETSHIWLVLARGTMESHPCSQAHGESQITQTIGLDELPTSSQSQSTQNAGEQPWGRLFPLNFLFGENPHPLWEDEVTVGRAEECTIGI